MRDPARVLGCSRAAETLSSSFLVPAMLRRMDADRDQPPFVVRLATREDLPAIVRLLADDDLGRSREQPQIPLASSYYDAFDAIQRDTCNELVVIQVNDEVVGTLQLTVIPYLTYQGGLRALVEAVRVDARYRKQRVGERLLAWVIARARARGCHMVQLTTDKRRSDAQRFYARLGFVASHEGMKLYLRPTP
jgi:GNAT superfamily N-acetyltransferase